MKSFSKYVKYLMIPVLCIAIYSCGITDIENNKYIGETFAAFKFQQDQVPAASDSSYSYALEVQIIRPKGGKLEKALNVNYVVVDSLTTATSPDDYSFVTPSPVTVPADCLRTELVISIDGSTIPSGEARVLTIQLTGNQERGVEGADIIGEFKLTIAGN